MRTSDERGQLRRYVSDARLQPAFTAILVSLETKRYVNRSGRVEFGNARRKTPSNCLELAASGRQAELEAVSSNQSRGRYEVNAASYENRRWVSHSERFEVAKHPLELVVRATDRDLEIDFDFRDQVFGRERSPRNFVESRCERGNLIASDGDPRRHLVTTESQQKIAALRECRVKIERVNPATRAFTHITVDRDQNRGATEFLNEPRRDDADNAWMPALAGEDDAIHVGEIHRGKHLPRLIERLVIELLAPRIQLLELSRNGVCLVLVFAHEQLHSAQRVTDASRSVQPRRENESHSTSGENFAFHPGGADHRPQPDISRFRQHPETISHENPVFSLELRNVSDRCQRNQVEHAPDERIFLLEVFGQRERELERNADRGEVLVRVFAATLLGIQYRETIRQRFAWQVMIGDDHIDAGAAKLRNRLTSARPAIAGNNYRRVMFDRSAHAGTAKVVSIFYATRNECDGLRSKLAERSHHDRRGADTIDVIIAVNEHGLAVCAGARESVDRLGKSTHRETVAQMVESGTQKFLCCILVGMPANDEKIGDRFGNA